MTSNSLFLVPTRPSIAPIARIMKEYTTSMISKKNRYKLANFGKAGESLNDAFSNVLKNLEEER